MKRLSTVENSREFKKRRRDRNAKRNTKVRQLEIREGTQYQSGLGFSASQTSTDQIPPPVTPPEIRQASSSREFKTVVFDLETTSRGNLY